MGRDTDMWDVERDLRRFENIVIEVNDRGVKILVLDRDRKLFVDIDLGPTDYLRLLEEMVLAAANIISRRIDDMKKIPAFSKEDTEKLNAYIKLFEDMKEKLLSYAKEIRGMIFNYTFAKLK